MAGMNEAYMQLVEGESDDSSTRSSARRGVLDFRMAESC